MKHDILEQQALAGLPLECYVVDSHAHIGTGPSFPLYRNDVDSFIESMDRIGCDVCCISPYAGLKNYADIGLREIVAAVECYPDRIFGYITADVGYPESIERQIKAGLAAGLTAMKIHVSSARLPYSHPNYVKLFELANEHALPILIHTWGAELPDLEPLFPRYPKITFVLGHAGSCQREKYAELALRYDNVCLELCFSASPKGIVEYFVRRGLVDKMLWGSDTNFYSCEHQIGRVVFADIDLGDKYKILGRNAARLILKRELPESYI